MNDLFEGIVDLEADCVPVISLVEQPAIELDFEYFSSGKVIEEFSVADAYEQKLAGPIMVPDKRIYREDAEGKPYDIFFSRSTVAGMAEAFSRNLNNKNITIAHSGVTVPVVLVESWLTGRPDKSESFGYDLPEGTWFGVFRVMDKDFFDKYVVTGKVRGLSIEVSKIQRQPIQQMTKQNFEAYPIKGSETPLEAAALEVGAEATVNGQKAPDGPHELEDGTVVTVLDGVITEVKQAEQLSEEPAGEQGAEGAPAVDAKQVQDMVDQIVEQRMKQVEERLLAIEDSIRAANEKSETAMSKVDEFGKTKPAAETPAMSKKMADQLSAIEAMRKGGR